MSTSQKKAKYQNKSAYLNTALNIVDQVGVEKLTMRKVAERMNVSPMAIYKHFPNKEALLRETLDEFISRADVIPDQDLPWEQWVQHVAYAMFNALSGETSWLPTLGAINVGPNALAVTSAFINKLSEEGFSFNEALEAYLAIVHLVIGSVTIQTALNKSTNNLTDDLQPLAQNDLNSNQLAQLVGKNQIEIGLPFLLDGIKNRLK